MKSKPRLGWQLIVVLESAVRGLWLLGVGETIRGDLWIVVDEFSRCLSARRRRYIQLGIQDMYWQFVLKVWVAIESPLVANSLRSSAGRGFLRELK